MWRKSLIFLGVALSAPGLANADHRVDMTVEFDAQLGNPTTTVEQTLWIREDKLSLVADTHSVVVDVLKDRMWLLDHANKAYYAIELSETRERTLPRPLGTIAEISQAEPQVKSKAAVSTEILDGRRVRRHEVSVTIGADVSSTALVWQTDEVSIPVAAWSTYLSALAAMTPSPTSDVLREIQALDGFTVKWETTTSMFGQETTGTTRVISVTQATPDAGAYGIPHDYVERPFEHVSPDPESGRGENE